MYHVYRNIYTKAAAAYSSLYFFFFFPILNQLEFSSHFSWELWGVKVPGRHGDNGLMYCVYWNRTAAAYMSHYLFIFVSSIQT